ncbi:MAG TPA: type I 3-dehydroquinate dehydratase [Blastocatellia bacterium]|nr:type I 3-dehydroquinate dehydratase [Blastocatellia bacterium]
MAEAILVATLKVPPSSDGGDLLKLASVAGWLEVRADLVGWLDPAWLRSKFPGRLLYTLRSREEGGSFDGTNDERRQSLIRASREYDLVDIEANRDLVPELLAEIPSHKRVVSWHSVPREDVEEAFKQLSSVAASFYKLVIESGSPGDGLAPLRLLSSLNRPDVTAYANGQAGLWTRLIAPRLGAPLVFGVASETENCEPTISRLVEDYGLPTMAPLEEVYGIVGNPVSHSLSPRLHNAAYRAMARPALFLPFQVDSFADFWREVAVNNPLESIGISMRGLTVVSPYKEASLESAGVWSAMVHRAGAANIFVRNNGHWRADTTDPEGVVLAIRRRGIALERRRAAVVGCGGAGRAVAAALEQEGAAVTLVNRGLERGGHAVRLLGLPFAPLAGFKAAGFQLLVNATPIGRDGSEMPFDLEALSDDAVVVDLAYGRNRTPLVEQARSRGLITIDGKEVLLIQVARQFQMMIGRDMPDGLAHQVLGLDQGAPAHFGTTSSGPMG